MWQDERFDRIVRNECELRTFHDYILSNPAAAQLPDGALSWGRAVHDGLTDSRKGGQGRPPHHIPPATQAAKPYNPNFASAAAIAAMNASGVGAFRKVARSAGSFRILQSALTTAR